MTMIGIYGTLFPDRQIALIFAPMYPFSADTGIKALGLLDSIGKKILYVNCRKYNCIFQQNLSFSKNLTIF